MARSCWRGQAGVLGSGETLAYFNPSQGNLRQDFKEGKNPAPAALALPAPWKIGLSVLKTDVLGPR